MFLPTFSKEFRRHLPKRGSGSICDHQVAAQPCRVRFGASPMLDFLFGGLTAQPAFGAALFDAATREARCPHWYREGNVPDTLEGRFALLATVTALVMVRLEALGADGGRLSVALTERFVEVMESEHRELGIGDPTLGKTVRKLVAALSRRVDIWRATLAGEREWSEAASDSLPGGPDSAGWREKSLRALADRLEVSSLEQLAQGQMLGETA
jgi:cytochrome b pre-mRNA-processing protein 3